MVEVSAAHSADSERAEVEAVLAALIRTPRLAKLLGYLADKYFAGDFDEIVEYNIATDVFGRSKTAFDASRDSIARVEAYRLRKRLKEYYEAEGKDHLIQITLPPGSYVPAFIRRTPAFGTEPLAETKSIPAASDSPPLAQPTEIVHVVNESPGVPVTPASGPAIPGLPPSRRRSFLFAALACLVLLLAGLALARFLSWRHSVRQQEAIQSADATSNQSATPADAAKVPLRILAGYQGSPQIDSAGDYWLSDRYFQGGAAYARPPAPIGRTSDPMIFGHWRTGTFYYNIPVAPGPYELHLFFVSSQPEEVSPYTFHVDANWKLLLPSFNISSDALGANVADERVFRDVYPTSWGSLHLGFTEETGSPSLSAIELLPGLPHKQRPIRIVMQKTAVTDSAGNVWHPDTYFEGGRLADIPRHVAGTSDPNVYTMERYGHFKYVIPVDARDRYTLVLHFAEMYWGPKASGQGGAGSRIFRVYCNGDTLLDNFDIYKEVGSLHALTKTFYHLKPSPEGKLNLTFEPVVNFATISAIEVIDESK
ncbi:MAG: malectin domain-containing carbohydrate-binding protein [Acidobacteriota bacterium]